MKKAIWSSLELLAVLVLVASVAGCRGETGPPESKQRLRVATTTSLYDTGLWGYLEPIFEKEYGVEVDVLYAGTGIALEYGRRGDVDLITVHSRALEQEFVTEGYGIERVPFARNYYVIAGPPDDPAGIKGMAAEAAFQRLLETRAASFVSRGDDSGTHSKEMDLWKAAGYDHEMVKDAGQWYVEAGRGMGPTLLMANEMQAYTLTDIGTFLSYRGKTSLVPIVDEGSGLLNVYTAIACSPEKNPEVNAEMAQRMVEFLASPRVQRLIGEYGTQEYGKRLFSPSAVAEPSN